MDEPPSASSFEFSTAGSRYCAALFAMEPCGNQQTAEAQVFALFKSSLDEEAALTDKVAARKLAPAISRCLGAIVASALPMFRRASTDCLAAARP